MAVSLFLFSRNLALINLQLFDVSCSALQVESPLSYMIGIQQNFLGDFDFKYSNCYSSVYYNCCFVLNMLGVSIDMLRPTFTDIPMVG